MSEENQAVNVGNLPVEIKAQYIKDSSFENPNAPALFGAVDGSPVMDVNIDMDAKSLNDKESLYEVVLTLTAKASRGDKAMFLAQIQYGALVSLKNVPNDAHHPLLLIDIPSMLFPFARQILADMTQNGGYPPLLLNPVDFRSMYMNRFAKNEEKPEVKSA